MLPQNLLSLLPKDGDVLLILGIVLLLLSDGGDRMLIMALVYIMS